MTFIDALREKRIKVDVPASVEKVDFNRSPASTRRKMS